MKFDILTIFPKIIDDYAGQSILKRAIKAGKIKVAAHDFRKFAADKHHTVDDKPYGGGPGMVLKVEPIYRALRALKVKSQSRIQSGAKAKNLKSRIVILDPAGKKFDQKTARRFAKLNRLVLVCGRYEGFDERIYKFVDETISIGDYVLSGGELGALVVLEAVARLVPGVVGNPRSLVEETFNKNSKSKYRNSKQIRNPNAQDFKHLKIVSDFGFRASDLQYVEYPQYTRPAEFMGMKAPNILLSGNAKKIEEWRMKKTRGR